MARRWAWRFLAVFVTTTYVAMLAPLLVIVIEAFSSSDVMKFPPTGYSLRWFRELLGHQDFIESFRISLILALLASLVATAFGTMAAYALVRLKRHRQEGIEAFLLAPLYTPRVILGMALLLAFSRVGLSGTLLGMTIAHVLITMPFVIRAVVASLADLDPAIEEAARVLGATPRQAVVRAVLPNIRTGVIAGSIFAFVISFSDLYLALFISGPETVTLPLRLFSFMEWEETPLVAAVSTVQIAIVIAIMGIAERLFKVSTSGRI